MRKLRDFNSVPENYTSVSPKDPNNVDNWGGENLCTMLEAAYHLAFICLLCVDEVLKIEHHHIEQIHDTKYKLTLPFRKTHQFGGCLTLLGDFGLLISNFDWQISNRSIFTSCRSTRLTSALSDPSAGGSPFQRSTLAMSSGSSLPGTESWRTMYPW